MDESVVFFGSGPVAARALELLQSWCSIEAVITKPQPPHHRELFPVIDITQKYELPLLTASNRAELDELVAGQNFKSRVAVLVDYGIIVSQAVIDTFPLGIVNSHFSILPEWRGADPISFSILSGQKSTGVSLMLLVPAMDEGPLLAFGEYDLPEAITTPELTDDLIDLSDELLKRALPQYLAGQVAPQPQTVTGREVSYSRKLTKEDGVIDWNKPAAQLEREVRAYVEWPKSRTELAGKEVVLTATHVEPLAKYEVESLAPGTPFVTPDKQLAIVTFDGLLIIDRLKPAGKQEMTGQAFLAGYGSKL